MRVFVGIELPADLRDRLMDLCDGVEGARWQRFDQFHLTLRFIGELDRHQLEDVTSALADIRFRRFPMTLQGVGYFGTLAEPRVLWAGVADAAPVAHLARKVTRALRRAGVPEETRKFAAHVTLARCTRRTAPITPWLSALSTFRAEPVIVEHFTLFESRTHPAGAEYAALARFPAEDADLETLARLPWSDAEALEDADDL
ncbi:MAG: RNA 2',3'-cyclic phosphodiesterase [Rhodothalassiaceae bacterium]|nr:MAG: RNA 2',3'-cyclic phosphodiesterase [Rhodothalassiaceae bacterium]